MVNMSVFDFGNAKEFFASIERVNNRYRRGPAKSTEDLLYVIMGLNHLREWISPGYNPGRNRKWPTARNKSQEFSRIIYENQYFTIICSLCSLTKHVRQEIEADAQFGLSIHEWPDVPAVAYFRLGPPKGHCVNVRQIEVIIDPIIDMYNEWFISRPND